MNKDLSKNNLLMNNLIISLPEEMLVIFFQCINDKHLYINVSNINLTLFKISQDKWVLKYLKIKYNKIVKTYYTSYSTKCIRSIRSMYTLLPNGKIKDGIIHDWYPNGTKVNRITK